MSNELIQRAIDASAHAYAPYSRYTVGAAVLGEDGNIYAGCNVENASYGLSICAERSAVFAMVAAGCKRAIACAVATRDSGSPCGACRQVLAEFATDPTVFQVICVGGADTKSYRLSELLPHAFRLEDA